MSDRITVTISGWWDELALLRAPWIRVLGSGDPRPYKHTELHGPREAFEFREQRDDDQVRVKTIDGVLVLRFEVAK